MNTWAHKNNLAFNSPVVKGVHDQSLFQFLTIPYKVEFQP